MIRAPYQIRRSLPKPPLDPREVFATLNDLPAIKAEFAALLENFKKESESRLQVLDEAIVRAQALEDGEDGEDAVAVNEDAIVEKVLSRIPPPSAAIISLGEETIVNKVLEKVPLPKKGDPGAPGSPGTPGATAVVDYDAVIKKVLKQIPKPEKPKEVKIDHAAIADKVVEMLQTDKKLNVKHIDGFAEGMEQTLSPIRRLAAGFRGGGDTVRAGSNVTITTDINGKKVIAATSGTPTIYSEVLTDSGDHKNYTAAHTITSVLSLQDGTGKGVPLKDASGNTNYTFSGVTLTLASADADLASLGLNLIYA